MSKHTPGPWYIGKDFSDQGRHIYAAQKVRHEDGDEWHPLIATTDDDERLVNWQANARLIAAAPDLLEALKKFAFKHRKTYGLDGAWDEEITMAEAAIAKATAAAQPAPVPLTDDARGLLVIEHLGPNALLHKPMSIYDAFHMGIDAAESAHGITGENT